MAKVTQNYKTILVGTDGSSQAKRAYGSAIEVAKRNDGKIIVVVAIQNNIYDFLGYGNISGELLEKAKTEHQSVIDEFLIFAKKTNFKNIETEIVYGNPREVLSSIIPKKYNVDLIVVGQSGLNTVERFMVGSVSQYLVSHAPCDVLVVHPENNGGF